MAWSLRAFLISVALHGAAFASLENHKGWTITRNPPSEVSFQVTPAPPEPLPEPPEPEEAPRASEPALPKPTPARAPEPELRPQPEAAPLDLRGLTLTNDSGGFAMPVGNEQPLDRPIGMNRTPPAAPSVTAPAPAPAPPSMIAFALLGTRPSPPSLEGALRQNYPADARRRAIGGSATVRARIESDGIARGVRIVSETFGGFGEACRRTLAGSRWSPPRDAGGKAVSTEVSYTCRFKVEP